MEEAFSFQLSAFSFQQFLKLMADGSDG